MTIKLARSDDPRVSVIISCSTRTDLLARCLQSLARFAPAHIPFETIVVLNGPDAGKESELPAAISGVDVVRSAVNLGVAGAANLARSHARGTYLILLHDDAEIVPGWMEALVETADAHPEAAAVGSKVLFPDGTLQSAGMILWREAFTSPRWVGEPPAADTFRTTDPVDYCATASLLVRAKAWDEVGGLDEELYPAYFVDVDLCMALRQCGYVILFEPRSQAHHRRGASTRARFRHFVANRNREHFMAKWAEALAQQEPFARDSSAAIARAMTRAQSSAGRRPSDAFPARRMAHAFDAARCEDEHRARAEMLRKAYLAHLEKIADEADTDRERLRTEVENLSHEKQQIDTRLRREKEEVLQSLDKVWHAREQLAREKAELEQTLAEAVRQRQAAEQAHAAILRSRTWRMTAPLRGVIGLLRKLFPKECAPQ
jgi:GT2 family glycosyltransferase